MGRYAREPEWGAVDLGSRAARTNVGGAHYLFCWDPAAQASA